MSEDINEAIQRITKNKYIDWGDGVDGIRVDRMLDIGDVIEAAFYKNLESVMPNLAKSIKESDYFDEISNAISDFVISGNVGDELINAIEILED